jgi:sugar/nucleoside kinase (ribokinase family)
MAGVKFDVVGLGNAIVDVLSPCDAAFLKEWQIEPNSMTLIDEPRAEALTSVARDPIFTSGGSGANTISGIASFGGRAAYIGKVAPDSLGEKFKSEIAAEGVHFHTVQAANGPATARCIIFVEADGARSMSTYLGASSLFSRTDIDEEIVRASAITYLEGYLFDRDDAKAAFVHAAEVAKAAGRRVALTLSDSFCVARHRESFRHLARGHVDILFANETELLSLYETEDFDDAVEKLKRDVTIGAVTRSEKGSVVVSPDTQLAVPAFPVDAVIDTTGAGDQFAAGFLFGQTCGASLETCAKLGHLAAAEVIGHWGPRPQRSYAELARANSL